ncbi:DUF5000 domain-containing lipoprotein [Chitinophaga niabensis]|uniref:DUF5000 domain-containing lipoprotein n=1 Tax=Chitinophaga niabensis TaxID=536979 RepID=UPI0031BA176E
MKRHHILILLLGLFLWSSCKEKGQLIYMDDSAPAPAPVTNITVVQTPGGAKLHYKIPSDKNLLFVKAVYDIQPGVFRESETSIFKDTLIIEGFGDTQPHEVKIYSVGRNKKESAPVSVTVTPLTPPVHSVFTTLTLKETFGGASVTFQNQSEASLAIVLMRDTTGKGDWTDVTTYYTASPKGAFSARGFDTIPIKFATYVRDRWNNKSDTLIHTLKPIFETKLDRLGFKEVSLPTDVNIGHVFSNLSPRNISFLFNNVWGAGNTNDCFHTRPNEPKMPQWFTFDIGAECNLSRFKLYHRGGTSGFYRGGDPKKFEIWGSNNPNTNGDFDASWTLLAAFQSVKPSGSPLGTNTSEDEAFAVTNGEDFEFPPGTPSVRYLRFKTTETWGLFQYIYISELVFWGAKK